MAHTIVKSQVSGTVVEVVATDGATVATGDVIALLECMKMEIPVVAPIGGTLRSLGINAGDVVSEGQSLARIES